jgi:hypothetical protein
MDETDLSDHLERALRRLVEVDADLFTWNVSERCIAARLAHHLQNQIEQFSVDVEYNRIAHTPKTLNLPEECAKARGDNNEPLVIPDIIVHCRGPEGPNLLVIEVKKTTNPFPRNCDRLRLHAFREQLHYRFGALIEFETRREHVAAATVTEWLS